MRGAQSLAEVFNIVCVFDREERYPRGPRAWRMPRTRARGAVDNAAVEQGLGGHLRAAFSGFVFRSDSPCKAMRWL